jgi:hypothetical protein
MTILNKPTQEQKRRVVRVHADVNYSNGFKTVIDAQSKLAEKAIDELNNDENQTLTLDDLEQEIDHHSDDLKSIFLELYNQCR